MPVSRLPSSSTRTAVEGGFWGAAALVAAQWAQAQFPEVDGVSLMAASAVGGFGTWFHHVLRNVAANTENPVVKAVLGVRTEG